jgi:hypothetical protein
MAETMSVSTLPYVFDLMYGLKTESQLQQEMGRLAKRLSDLTELCREHGLPIDEDVQRLARNLIDEITGRG